MADLIGSSPDTSGTLAIDSSQTSAIDFLGDTDWFSVSLIAGTTYVFDLEGFDTPGNAGGTLLDPLLVLFNSSGTIVLAKDNDGGIGRSSRVVFTPEVSGTYYLSAEESGNDRTGAYTLRANAASVSGSITIDSVQGGSIEFGGDTDWYSLSLNAGTTYVFDLQGGTLGNPLLELLAQSGAVIDFDDDSGPGLAATIVFTPTSSGIYYLAARASGNGATGTYTLSARVMPTVSVSDANVDEPDAGTAAAIFTVSLSSPTSRDVTVSYATSNDLALSGADYVPASGQVVIPAGGTSATFAVTVLGDLEFEPRETFAVRLSNALGAKIGDGVGFGIIEDNDRPSSVEFPSDRHFAWQWSLFTRYGANVLPVWADYTGEGVRVAVFDQGIDGNHPDLDGNLLLAFGRDAATLWGDGLPKRSGDNHGTAVAGVIGAERNGVGIVGVGYGADLVSIYSPLNESVSTFGTRVANAYFYARAVGADIVNDSWGFGNLFLGGANYAFVDDFASPNFAAAGQELYQLASLGRNGLGTIVVQSAGNSYGYGDDTNLHNFQNSRYIITVAASDYFGAAAGYSSPGASILITAPGGEAAGASGIVSTDRVGAAGFSTSDYVFLAGTSFSAPIVSGVVALMLEANPGLGYRDAQEILAYSAVRIGTDATNWEFNGAGNWNGGGLHYDGGVHQFGFGLVDALAAVRLAETWGPAHTVANLQELSFTRTPNVAIPDRDPAGTSDSILVTEHMEIERVDVSLDIRHPFIGDLSIALQSPGGVWSALLYRPGEGPYSAFGSSQSDIHFTFNTVANWGEDAYGTWTLLVTDRMIFDSGDLVSWTLTLTGKPASDDDTYIFTNEYAESFALDPARGTLIDTAGVDTLNAAAVTAASTIDLAPGAGSTIDGARLAIGASTVIEHAVGGDGNDAITGNAAPNSLRGMRGDDRLTGEGGDDTLDGGAGDDILDGGSGTDTAVFRGGMLDYAVARTDAGRSVEDTVAGRDGIDVLFDIERLSFSDLTLAFDASGGAGNAYALWNAAFDRPPAPEEIGRWIAPFDAGNDIVHVAQAFIDAYAPGISYHDEVDILYRNVVGAAPGQFEMDYYTGILDRGEMTQAELFVFAAKHDLNQADYIEIIAGGISYAPWLG
ncbi:MAG: S8 family serine peptidase [Betaproteobacteria bacterium]|nr:S8 family serine peptidase [Betaproteobacteria bacterium]